MNFVAYYRTSTKEQNLGITAQRTAITKFLKSDDALIYEYTEQESGKNNNREELTKAISHCKATGATLLIAKLDRLSRNLTFISQLMDNKVSFKCCDMPDANNFTIHIFAALAQQERELISTRTKAALAELKANGVTLGKPQNLTDAARAKGRSILIHRAKHNPNNKQVMDIIKSKMADGITLQAIADHLNKLHYRTSRGKEFKTGTIDMYIKRIKQNELQTV